MMKSGHVLFVIGSLTVGGAETQMAMLAAKLVGRGWSVDVFALDARGPLGERLEKSGILVVDGRCRSDQRSKAAKALLLLAAQARLLGHCLIRRPHVVNGFLPLTNFMAALAGRIGLAPLVVTSRRALGTHQDRHPRLKWLDHAANRLSHRITANSRAVALDTERRDGYPAARIAVIPNGLDMTRFDGIERHRGRMRAELGLNDGDVALVKVANLIAYKGLLDLIDAFNQLPLHTPDVRLFLVGEDRGIKDEMVAHLDAKGNRGRVHFLGARHDIPELLSAMDVGVMASHEEGFSNALIEKLAAGLPVVATDVGGNPEALDGMPDCVLVRPRNPDDLARGLVAVIEDEVSRHPDAKRQKAGRRRDLVRKRYSVPAMVDGYENLYRDGLARRRASGAGFAED